MLDSGDNAFVYSAYRQAIKNGVKGTEKITIDELNKHFSKEDIEKANDYDLQKQNNRRF